MVTVALFPGQLLSLAIRKVVYISFAIFRRKSLGMRLVAWCVSGVKVPLFPVFPIMVCTVVGTDKLCNTS